MYIFFTCFPLSKLFSQFSVFPYIFLPWPKCAPFSHLFPFLPIPIHTYISFFLCLFFPLANFCI